MSVIARAPQSEEDVAAIVVEYLELLGAEVYQEVSCSGGVADIVARLRAEIWIVEVKTSLSLALISQALERRRLAHRVFVAAPVSRNVRDFSVLCEELGIGLFIVRTRQDWRGQEMVEQRVFSQRWNKRPVALAAKLQPEHKTHAKAGSVGAAGRWTPFRNTCEQLSRLVAENPGVTLKSALSQIAHHYHSEKSARSSLAHWISEGKVAGVQLVRDGKHALLVPSGKVH